MESGGQLKIQTSKTAEETTARMRQALFVGLFLLRAAAVASLCLGLTAMADIKPELPTMAATGRAYYLTAKSGLAESNDTGLMTSYGLSVYAGSEKSVSVHLEGRNAAVSYALNNAKMSQSEFSFLIKVYIGFFFIGAYGGSTQHTITRSDSNTLDAFANQYGGTAGMLVNIAKGSHLGVLLKGGVPVDLKETNQQDVQMGLKLEGEICLNFSLTRDLVDLETGFYYSTQSASFGGAGNGETLSAPFLGLSLNTDF